YDVPADQWLASANAAIAAIRAAGADNLVLVPGTSWTGAHSWEQQRDGGANGTVMRRVADPLGRHAYEVHQYFDADFSGKHETCARAADGVAALERFTDWLRETGARGFLGEFGGSAAPGCLEAIADARAVVEGNADVWTGWAYWAAGDWWPESEPLNVQPTGKGDRAQLAALTAISPATAAGASCAAPGSGG
ncbi:glycoside hydrolase family 5 protein, partial [Rhizobium sp. TRM95111]|uniref:cellulase family glycosylhydrolase n=1 Tax=Rhizobium alarense TaxID=2846851 RepID=UPI001F1FA65B